MPERRRLLVRLPVVLGAAVVADAPASAVPDLHARVSVVSGLVAGSVVAVAMLGVSTWLGFGVGVGVGGTKGLGSSKSRASFASAAILIADDAERLARRPSYR